jgi:hypothetical protein
MTVGMKTIIFLLGMCLSVQIVAAFYRFLDLRYTIHTAYLKIVQGILIWIGIGVVIVIILGEQWRGAFLWGLGLYVPFYLLNFFLIRNMIRQWRQPKEIK